MTLTRAEILQHDTRQSCWVAIHGAVYDVTSTFKRKSVVSP